MMELNNDELVVIFRSISDTKDWTSISIVCKQRFRVEALKKTLYRSQLHKCRPSWRCIYYYRSHHLCDLHASNCGLIKKLGSPDAVTAVSAARTPAANAGAAPEMFVYECKTCNCCFPSFQALGGHRASHRKPKLPAVEMPATALSLADDHQRHQNYFQSAENSKTSKAEELGLSLRIACNSSNTLSASKNHHHNESNNKANKVHTCAICGAEFSSGQALGGHMRRHRPIAKTEALILLMTLNHLVQNCSSFLQTGQNPKTLDPLTG